MAANLLIMLALTLGSWRLLQPIEPRARGVV